MCFPPLFCSALLCVFVVVLHFLFHLSSATLDFLAAIVAILYGVLEELSISKKLIHSNSLVDIVAICYTSNIGYDVS